MEQKNIVAIEIGSSKIRGALGVIDSNGILSINAVEDENLVDCVRYGIIQNVAEVGNRINTILGRLEAKAPGRKITGVYVALGGKSLRATRTEQNRQYSTEVEITADMVKQLNVEALSTTLADRDILEVTPCEYFVDRHLVKRPEGSLGRNLQATLNLITARSVMKRNLRQLLENRLRLDVKGYVVRQLAQADLVITNDEKRLGCMLVDFGAETTTVSIYRGGALQYLATIPMGSRNITRDIASLNHLEEQAESLKKQGGNAIPGSQQSAFDAQEFVEINNYVSARAGEIIANINEQIKLARLTPSQLAAGIIIVGNGAKLKGFIDRLAKVTTLKVRAGSMPMSNIRILDPCIRVSEAIDVIAVLNAVALVAAECTVAAEPEIIDEPVAASATSAADQPAPDDIDDDIDDADIFDTPEEPRKRPISSFFSRFKDRFTDMMNAEENDDDDDNL